MLSLLIRRMYHLVLELFSLINRKISLLLSSMDILYTARVPITFHLTCSTQDKTTPITNQATLTNNWSTMPYSHISIWSEYGVEGSTNLINSYNWHQGKVSWYSMILCSVIVSTLPNRTSWPMWRLRLCSKLGGLEIILVWYCGVGIIRYTRGYSHGDGIHRNIGRILRDYSKVQSQPY